MTAHAFYAVADRRYFLGAVGLINSLRLQGHADPVYVLDNGLDPDQRRLLEPEATLVAGTGAPPWLAKTIAPLRHPADVITLIDADMIATRPLTELIEAAGGERVVAFENDRPRHFAEWGPLLDLTPPRKQPYVSSGLVVLGGDPGREVLELLDEKQRLVDLERTFGRTRDVEYPLLYPEQDVLNAILAGPVERERLEVLPHALAPTPPFDRVRIVDRDRLRCADCDGAEPYVLHQFVRKPWLEPMYHGVFSQLLARLLLGGDVAIRVPDSMVPTRMRTGARAALERWAVNVVDLGRWHLAERGGRSGR